MAAEFDHLVLATGELERTRERFLAATGVEPVLGGRHVGRGTMNYLVGLGPGRFLEIVGADPEQSGVEPGLGVSGLVGERLFGWAVRTSELDAAVRGLRAVGVDWGAVEEMGRRTPGGEELRWRIAVRSPAPVEGLVPFLLDWGSTPHPADRGLPQADLVEFRGTHPEPGKVRVALDVLGVDLPVSEGPAGLAATIAGPAGSYRLGS